MTHVGGLNASKKIVKILDKMNVPNSALPFIIGLTGHTVSHAIQSEGLKSGMNRVIQKPLKFKDLVQIINDNYN